MKKLLTNLAFLTIASSSTGPILINIPQTNYQEQLAKKSDQNKLMENGTVKTFINEVLKNNQEDEKKYLIEAFDDTNLINKIQTELAHILHEDNKGYFIYQTDVDTVVSLDLSNSDITSFVGLDFFPNLTSLNIAENKQPINLADFQLIARNITVFDVSRNTINDIDIIMYFFSLATLNMTEMKMSADFIWDSLFLPLSGIATLTKLDLSDNRSISDISLLSTLTNLNSLNLDWNKISDISVLSFFKNLTSLSLSGNKISDFSVLSKLVNLTNLNLASSNFFDISVLSKLVNLTNLGLYRNSISDISVLSSLTNLVDLNLGNNSISDISVLSSLTNLNYLYLESNSISDISVLSTLTKIIQLDLSGNSISDISVLSSLTKIIQLALSQNSISDISVLSSLTNLTYLYLNSNSISDISVLSTLKGLRTLYLDSNSISDISVLSSLTNLTYLNLRSNYIPNTDEAWAVLHKLPNYNSDWDNEEVRNSQKVT